MSATFWLLEAPDSLAVQSRREPDGTGLGVFDEQGRPHVQRQPIAAYEDRAFAERGARGALAHVPRAHPLRVDRRHVESRTRIRSCSMTGCSRTTA